MLTPPKMYQESMDAINAHLVQQTPTSGFTYTAELRPERTASGACVYSDSNNSNLLTILHQNMASRSKARPSRVLPRRLTDAGCNNIGSSCRGSLCTSAARRTDTGRASRLASRRGTHPDMHGDAQHRDVRFFSRRKISKI